MFRTYVENILIKIRWATFCYFKPKYYKNKLPTNFRLKHSFAYKHMLLGCMRNNISSSRFEELSSKQCVSKYVRRGQHNRWCKVAKKETYPLHKWATHFQLVPTLTSVVGVGLSCHLFYSRIMVHIIKYMEQSQGIKSCYNDLKALGNSLSVYLMVGMFNEI